ncbi:MAG: 3',5'-cyclic-nucleotide phosphodiesterase [Rhodocyclaceae bacterium]|jgi:ribonuclease BN (tRNA processing enzyme)|nr:3',5'-cyclic-nucleotide phosphodiesterase [Rhodocyclaceae bacterium]MCA4903405.1 3',5'-cyclic-nucleotide phosphodiesterase [Rhodocyclaceae bacterium]
MKLRVLGCSGGIGGSLRTTSFVLDEDVLVDAGTGVGDLNIEELQRIDRVFLTHSHLDHVTSLPFLVDTVGWMRDRPLTVHALPETIEVLRQHLFNWKLWPDFAQIPDALNPWMHYQPVAVGERLDLGRGRSITPLPANHVVPAVGYHLDSGRASLVYTGDTTVNEALWPMVNRIDNLRYLIIETAFRNREHDLARTSKHLSPMMLADELEKLQRQVDIYITHLKPGEYEAIMEEIQSCAGRFGPQMLLTFQQFEF